MSTLSTQFLQNRAMRVLCALLSVILLCALPGCRERGEAFSLPASYSESEVQQNDIDDIMSLLQNAEPQREITRDFLQWACRELSPDFAARLRQELESNGYEDALFFRLYGSTLLVLHDLYSGAAEAESNIHLLPPAQAPLSLAFTGDINLSDTWENMLVLAKQENGIEDCISAPLLQRMRQADILLVNNEFCFSDGGSAMPGKQYVFRAQTKNVQILQQMGVDIVSLANNHVFDYGEDAFMDTLDTLRGAGIPYVGAGRDRAEAMLAQYFIAGGMKVAYVAASRAEKYILTPEATDTQPGVLRCYDTALLLQAVETARQNADVVVVYPHWGTENTTRLEEVQVELGRQLIDTGADLVIGAHPHCLQGIEFYQGRPIVYSLGNFWFNTATVDTALLEVTIEEPGSFSVVVQPCLQRGGKTSLLTEESDRQRIFDHLIDISENITISPQGLVLPAGLE